jgi:phosphate transport system substrate-binding protein
MASGEFDFGCTDAPMSDEDVKEAEKSGRQIVHVPVALAAVAPIYNLPDLKGRMRFSGAVLAGIFLGKIHRWNAPELEALNPTIALPDHEIAVVHRLDSSGTTYVWSEYLAKVSPEWKDTIGVGKTVPWPLGVAAKGNEGVAGQVKQIPASIGYAQLTYALRETLQYGSVQNGEGEFVDPLPAAVTAAAGGISKAVPEDLRFSLTNAPEKSSYPISATTWAVVYARQTAAKGARIADFLRWVVHDGQQFAEGLNYAPLPQPLVERGEARIASISVRNDVGAQAAQAEATP